jgi:hypothetical protein
MHHSIPPLQIPASHRSHEHTPTHHNHRNAPLEPIRRLLRIVEQDAPEHVEHLRKHIHARQNNSALRIVVPQNIIRPRKSHSLRGKLHAIDDESGEFGSTSGSGQHQDAGYRGGDGEEDADMPPALGRPVGVPAEDQSRDDSHAADGAGDVVCLLDRVVACVLQQELEDGIRGVHLRVRAGDPQENKSPPLPAEDNAADQTGPQRAAGEFDFGEAADGERAFRFREVSCFGARWGVGEAEEAIGCDGEGDE